jgi:D-amino peptidase
MNVFISTDMEGISGVSMLNEVMWDCPEYQHGRERLMADVNAAVSAAFDAGAEKVYVSDGHGKGTNFIEGKLDKRATQVWIQDLSWVMKDVEAVVELGNHAMSGTQGAFLDHTQWSMGIHHYLYNGERMGEAMQMAIFAGRFGVPIVAVTGDKHVCEEAKRFFGESVALGCVKVAKKRNIADCMPNEEAEKIVYETVKKGIENRKNCKPIIMQLPFEIKVEFNRCDFCEDACATSEDIERVDAFTARVIRTQLEKYKDALLY